MVKKHLGRGLKALFPEDAQISDEVQNKNFIEIDVEELRPNPYQVREDFSSQQMEDLKNSIKEKGIIQPLTVRRIDNGYELIAGERRLRAAKEIGIKRIPAYIITANDKEEILELMLVENIQRENLNPIELAKSYKRLIEECKLTQEEVARKISVDRTTITNMLRLLNLPEEVKDSVKKGEITVGHARTLLTLQNPKKQISYLEKIIKNQMSVRELESIIYKLKSKKEKKVSKSTDKKDWVKDFENRIREILGTKVSITEKKEKGYIKIEYYTLDELERIVGFLESAEKSY
jgi:ParB family chromosome partitioning protein